MAIVDLDQILWRHLSELPYFRAMLRAVEDSFYQNLDLPSPTLDVGSGDGHFASVAFNRPLDVGLDPWAAPMAEARARQTYRLLVQADAARSPFLDGWFASAVSNSVLEHIPHIEAVLADVARVMRPGAVFYFCVPNHRFPELLLGKQVFDRLGLHSLAERYSRFFNRIARHAHCDSPEVWQRRLEDAGFALEKSWDYFPPQALHVLETGHLFGLPAWVCHLLTGKWILVKSRTNLALPWKLTRRFMDNPLSEEGVCTFFVARRKSS
jgi:SAM-dependent methyltransferase